MTTNEILTAIDVEISRLTQVRTLLEGLGYEGSSHSSHLGAITSSGSPAMKRRGRPKGSKSGAASFNPEEFAPKRGTMSAAGKERIAAAQRARWAKHKRTVQAAKRSAPTQTEQSTTKPAAKTASVPARKVVASKVPKPVSGKKAAAPKKAAVKAAPAKKVAIKAAKRSAPAKKSFLEKVPASAQTVVAPNAPVTTL